MLYFLVAAIVASLSIKSVSSTCARLDRMACEQAASCLWDDMPEEGRPFCRCSSNRDNQCIFAMDISGSIGSDDFEEEKIFVCDMIWSGLTRDSTVATLTFGSSAVAQYTFQMNDDNNNLRKPVCDHTKAIQYTGGLTYMLDAVKLGNDFFEYNRDILNDNKPRIFFLITDGNPSGGQNPCDNNQMAIDARTKLLVTLQAKVVFVGVGGGVNPNNVDCLWDNPSQVIMADSFDPSDLEDIRFLVDSFLCPVSLAAKLSEIRIAPGAGGECIFVELWNSGLPWGMRANPMNLEGAVTGRLGGVPSNLENPLWEPDKMLVLYHGRTCRIGAPRCRNCNCRLGNLVDGKCDNALYIECNKPDAPCQFAPGFNRHNFWIKVIHENTGDVVVDYDEMREGCCANEHVRGYSCELHDPFDADYLDCANWKSSCLPGGTPGAIPIRPNDNRAGGFPENCDALYECSKEHCRMGGDRMAVCRGSPPSCQCSDGYSEVCLTGDGIVKSCSCQ